ncbi:MAG: translation initiation factor IF-2 [Leptospirales bacterium]
MDNIKKKKLVLKKGKKSGSIAAKIAKKHQQDKADEIKKLEREKIERIAKEKALELEQKQKSATKAPSSVQPSAPAAIIPDKKVPVTQAPSASTPSKDKAKKQKSHLREDILKQEEHKKFFLKQQKMKRQSPGSQDSGSLSSSIPKAIKITEYIQVGELARKLNIKTSDIIAKLMQMGVMATITQSIDAETASLVSAEYGCKATVISLYEETVIEEEVDEETDLVFRPPVVTIMGHVDHGKTKLLDALRETDIVSREAGGITQHIGAYQVETPKGKITFLDTPGHEAFTAMRARGAQVTDIVVLVVAADDGIMPQTVEAISHAQDAGVPMIVAINKMDVPDANPERVLQQLGQYQLVPEEWGGTTPVVQISALKRTNLDKLEEVILTTAEVLELRANPDKKALGTVIEAKLDQGRGPVATILISGGKIGPGSPFVAGLEGGKIRAMFNDRGQKITEAGPATPIEILGLNGVPKAGDPFHVMESEKDAKKIMEKRQELNRQQQAQKIKKVKLENLNEIIEEGNIREFKLIIKGDVHGSVEAIQESLEKLSTSEVRVHVIYSGTGEVTETDVMLASAGNALIITFNTRANARVREVAEKEGIEVRQYTIIYQVIDDIKIALTGMLAPEITEEIIGEVSIREVYKISNLGLVAGCMVTSGKITKNAQIRLIRNGAKVFDGKLKSLKRFKDDAAEVKEGFECGILIEGYNDMKADDIVEAYIKKETARSLESIVKADDEKNKKSEAESKTE